MYRLIGILLQPFLLSWLVLAAGLLIARRSTAESSRRRLGVAWLGFAMLTVAGCPVASHFGMRSMERQFSPLTARGGESAIVVLGGGVRDASGELPEELSEHSMYRCIEAARLYHEGIPCPVVVTGHLEAAPMRRLLLRTGIPEKHLIAENQALSTHESAVRCAQLAEQNGWTSLVLVTDALHMQRSLGAFEHQGLTVTAAACNFRARPPRHWTSYFLPSPGAASANYELVHEWVGLVWYRLRGRL